MNDYLLLPLTLLGITAIEAMGLQLILGGAGLLTLGHTAFFAIGGYASAGFVVLSAPSLGIHHPALLLTLGCVCGVVVSGLLAFLIAIPCLRFRGDYLAVATMGFGQIIENLLFNIPAMGGASGFTNIPHLTHASLVAILVVGLGVGLGRFYKTGIGQSILCARDDEIVARCFGISPEKSKLIAFIIGSMMTGLAGVLYVHTFQFISPPAAGFQKSVEILLAVIIGGMFSVWGSVLGAAILVLVPELLRFLPTPLISAIKNLCSQGICSEEAKSSLWAQILGGFFQNSMLIFSIAVLMMIRLNPAGLSTLFLRYKQRRNVIAS